MTVNILTAQHVQQIGRNLSLDGSFLKTKEERADVWKISSFPFSLLLKNEEKSIKFGNLISLLGLYMTRFSAP